MNIDDIETSSPQTENTTEESAGSVPQTEVEAVTPEAQEPSDNFQKRIDTVVGQRNSVRLENEELKRQLEARNNVEIPTVDASEPTLEQFEFDQDKYNDALINYRVEKGANAVLSNYVQAQQQASQQVQQDNVISLYNQRAQDFSTQVTDWNEALGGLQLTPQAQQAIMASDMGPQIAYSIAKDPALMSQMNQMDSMSAFMKVGELAQTVRVNGVTNKISSAPDPITPPNGGGGALKAADLENLSTAEFMQNQGVVKTSR